MQVRAIFEAAAEVAARRPARRSMPEIMIPLVGDAKELDAHEGAWSTRSPSEVSQQAGAKVEYLVGTMIEMPRAALRADEIAEDGRVLQLRHQRPDADDLRPVSRDDAGTFLPDVPCEQRHPRARPVPDARPARASASWSRSPCERGRKARTDLKLGICGEHGGDPASVDFCHKVGPRLRLLLALPRADRAAGRGAGGAGRPAQDGMTPLARAAATGGKGRWRAALADLERDARRRGDAWRCSMRPGASRAAHVVGLTGPPGVGKSSLCAALVAAWREAGKTVGVIAVDPSSRRSGGALLGDRVRIVPIPTTRASFVRSMAARDRLGGLADQTLAAMVLMRALFDLVLIETVGVGQSETDVAGVADTVVFCVQPGSGDSLQFMKAGIVEIPHVIAVTKADLGARGRAGARRRGGRAVARHGGRRRLAAQGAGRLRRAAAPASTA